VADRYYYSHDQQKLGPCSDQQLKDLAATGDILPTDTVWKEGIDRGVVASNLKNLFRTAPTPDDVPATVTQVAPPVLVEVKVESVPAVPAPAELPAARAPVASAAGWNQAARKGRATAGRGTVVVSQDGFNVKFRKKCTTCGHADPSWNTMPIRNGTMRVGFYCPKCRKHRDAEVHGRLN